VAFRLFGALCRRPPVVCVGKLQTVLKYQWNIIILDWTELTSLLTWRQEGTSSKLNPIYVPCPRWHTSKTKYFRVFAHSSNDIWGECLFSFPFCSTTNSLRHPTNPMTGFDSHFSSINVNRRSKAGVAIRGVDFLRGHGLWRFGI